MVSPCLLELEAENRGLDCIEQWQERETLSQTLRGLEEASHSAIDKRGNPGRADVGFDPSDQARVKPIHIHYFEEKWAGDLVKCIG